MRVLTGNKQAVPVKAWVDGVELDIKAEQQLRETAQLPFIHKHLAVMPDAHWGMGSTVGSVIATKGAIIPAAVGVDIGCGMVAARLTDVSLSEVYEFRQEIYDAIVATVPHGRTDNGGLKDKGRWQDTIPRLTGTEWGLMSKEFDEISMNPKHQSIRKWGAPMYQLGTLGGGNHFIEVCSDENDEVWVMLHSGSRGIGNRIGSHFIRLAQAECETWHVKLPNKDLAYLPEGTQYHDEYVQAVGWAQNYAKVNRDIMLNLTLNAMGRTIGHPIFPDDVVVNCHHNYVQKENHYGSNVFVTRKGAVRARVGDLGIIPGSMGDRSYIVEGLGNPLSFNSCSHGAGRVMSRSEAKRTFTVEDHIKATEGVTCRKDEGVIDETCGAYKDIDAVMAAQSDLVKVKHTLKQHINIKG
jgi:tRNA-splicing ligase RtcB